MTLLGSFARARPRTPYHVKRDVEVYVVQSLDEFAAMLTIRSRVFQSEQHCPYDEEFDGNDLSGATHLIAVRSGEPLGVMRIRWFADFAKLERFAVLPEARGLTTPIALMEAALRFAARKGYRRVLGHVQTDVVKFWERKAGAYVRPGRPSFSFSGYDYFEVICDLDTPNDVLSIDSPPLVLDRPEGDWDREGVLERAHKAAA